MKQMQSADLKYENTNVSFDKINDSIKLAFSNSFGRSPVWTLSQAETEIVTAINAQFHPYIYRKTIGFLFSQGGPYQNLYNPGWFGDISKFINFFKSENFLKQNEFEVKCGFCGCTNFQTEPLDARMMTFLFPVYSAYPNAFWMNNERVVTSICSLCRFILLHYHLGFARLADGTWMFVNAPSFSTIYHLNKLVQRSFAGSTGVDSKKIREILATSVIEFATRMQTTFGIWTGMNIEVITKRGNQVEYFSLPYHVIKLISNRQVSALLSDIGEFRVLNLVINEEYSKLTEVGYRLLREAISDRRNYDYINAWLFLDRNKRNLSETANKLFKLYALIEQRRRNVYAY
jgi:hypothetical protein